MLADKAGLVGWLHPHAWVAVIFVTRLVLRRDGFDREALTAHRLDDLRITLRRYWFDLSSASRRLRGHSFSPKPERFHGPAMIMMVV